MNKWEHTNNTCSQSHLSYSHSCPIPICLNNLVPIPMGMPREGGESRNYHSCAHLYYLPICAFIVELLLITEITTQKCLLMFYFDSRNAFERTNFIILFKNLCKTVACLSPWSFFSSFLYSSAIMTLYACKGMEVRQCHYFILMNGIQKRR